MTRCLLLAGHGSHLNPDSGRSVREHAAQIRSLGTFGEVRVGFWKEEPALSRALDGCTAEEVVVVPVFMSSGYFTEEVIPRELRLEGPVSEIDGRLVHYHEPVGAHPALAQVIVQRAMEAGARPGDAVAVLGHGTPRNPNSERNIYVQAERVRQLGAFAEVTTVFLEQEPYMGRVFEQVNAETVIMVPLFVADGWHVEETIPADLALEGAELRSSGRRLRYARAVGTHPAVADVILKICGLKPGEFDSDTKGPATAWAERAWERGRPFVLGELAVRFTGNEAIVEREGSAGKTAFDRLPMLEAHVRFDDRGRYRPLPSARGIPGNWYMRCANPSELADTIEAVYPLAATHLGQQDAEGPRLADPDDVFMRQAGRYQVAQQLSPNGREAVIDTLCTAVCVKKPMWAERSAATFKTRERDLHNRSETVIPCPEPCSVFLALAREAALWEADPPQRAPCDPELGFAGFEEPGNEVREAYLGKAVLCCLITTALGAAS